MYQTQNVNPEIIMSYWPTRNVLLFVITMLVSSNQLLIKAAKNLLVRVESAFYPCFQI